MLAFHSKVSEAEAMAESVAGAARRLWENDPRRFPAPERVWAGWLCGGHSPGHRRAVLDEFACDVIEAHDDGDGLGLRPAALRVLSSVNVLGEGVDTANCDSVAFCDARGSMIDIVQMVGRALRMKPGEGKIASLIVPVFLAPGESPDEMLPSPTPVCAATVTNRRRKPGRPGKEARSSWGVSGGRVRPRGSC
ncbi:helicase-related protein [Streptosporangium nondiastaticum]|uniref:helicase-related protein n=1 Tax=Streptosporangium nondiastaticum TaxID=35764 RepID=UPI001CB96474|nr:helicase-related protein [Streptosporangium nondiastaticum]